MQEVSKAYNLTVTDTEKSMILRGLLLLENETSAIFSTSFGIFSDDLKSLSAYMEKIKALRSYMTNDLELIYDPSAEEEPEPDIPNVEIPAKSENPVIQTLAYLHFAMAQAATPEDVQSTEKRIPTLALDFAKHTYGDDVSESELSNIAREAVNAYFRKS